jgi:Ca-activated chloride channel family protein
MNRASLILMLGFLLVAGSTAKAQDQTTLKVDVVLQQVTSTVTDKDGRLVTDLEPQDFIIEVDGVPQRIEHFSHDRNVPLSLGLILDTSRSMETTMKALQGAAESFVSGMYPADESFIMTFDMNATVRQGFTHDPERLFKTLQTVNVGGSTGLVRGFAQARKKMSQAENPKHALIVISDGGDSFAGAPEIAKFEQQLEGIDLLVYTVHVQDLDEANTIAKLAGRPAATGNGAHSTPAAFVPDLAKQLMESMASQSAGKYFYVKMTSLPNLLARQLSRTFDDIFTELRGQYTIGFYPASGEVTSSRVRVRTVNPAYHIRTSAPHSRRDIETDDDLYETALQTGESAKRRGEIAEAIRALEHATILNSSDVRAFRALAGLYAGQGRFPQALEALNKVQSIGVLDGDDHLVFGTCLLQLGDATDALSHFSQALSFSPDNPQIYLQMTTAYVNLNQPAKALEILDQYLERFPDDTGHEAAVERAKKLRATVKPN